MSNSPSAFDGEHEEEDIDLQQENDYNKYKQAKDMLIPLQVNNTEQLQKENEMLREEVIRQQKILQKTEEKLNKKREFIKEMCNI